ncbi:MAG: ABC transporter permease [Dethiobacter sp.]|jgi:fluoroquinolone transport system permease protein|nr:MAG: ABC transporter permease [Dethiobacter sp.]
MYGSFIISELKKWLRDSMMRFMVFYPLLFGFIGRFLLPWIAGASGFSIDPYADLIVVMLALLTPQLYGALAGFSILEDRDDHVLSSIKVTPLSIHQFLSFRLVTVFILSLAACTFVIWFSDIGEIPVINILAISFLASLAAPVTGLLINAFSQNKIEGFAVMKGLGTIIAFPIIALFFMDARELFFSFAPGFWPAKAISSIIRGEGLLLMTYNQYYFIGLVYVLILNIAVYRLFLSRTQE